MVRRQYCGLAQSLIQEGLKATHYSLRFSAWNLILTLGVLSRQEREISGGCVNLQTGVLFSLKL